MGKEGIEWYRTDWSGLYHGMAYSTVINHMGWRQATCTNLLFHTSLTSVFRICSNIGAAKK